MSGLQASISVHIAREYQYPNGQWGPNHELFHRAVGAYPDRVNNLYFSFLFVLRGVVRLRNSLPSYDLHSGNATEDAAVKKMMQELVTLRLDESDPFGDHTESTAEHVYGASPQLPSVIERCRNGFDESVLFQVPCLSYLTMVRHYDYSNCYHLDMQIPAQTPMNWEVVSEKESLKEEFRLK